MVIQKSRIIELQRVVVSTYLKWLTCVISLLLSEYNTDAVCIESQSVTWNLQAVQDKQIIYAYNDSATSSCYKWQITHSGIALHVLKLQLLDLQLQSNCAGTSLSLHSGHSSSTGILDGGSWTKNSGPVLAMKVTGDKALVALVTCVGVPYRLILTYWNEQKDIKEEKAIESRPLNLALYALTGCIGCSVVIAIVLLIAVRNKAIILRKICASRNRSQKHVILVIPAEKSKTSSNIEEHISILEP